MPRIVEAKEFQDPDTVALARGLIGRLLVRRTPGGRVERHVITETEAYCGEKDLACHAKAGRTRRTEVMYAAGGVWYVYLCYGIHEMLNLVTGPADDPAAILIRGLDGISGPGRVTKALGIDRRLNAAPAAVESGLWIEDSGLAISRRQIAALPRVGVDYAGPVWSQKKWRFLRRRLSRSSP